MSVSQRKINLNVVVAVVVADVVVAAAAAVAVVLAVVYFTGQHPGTCRRDLKTVQSIVDSLETFRISNLDLDSRWSS